MTNTITKTTLIDGPRNLVVLVNITGDGSGDETATIIVDRSTFAPTDGLETTILHAFGLFTGFSARILADGSSDKVIFQIPDGQPFDYNWNREGGVSSNIAGAGKTGDILITTTGLASGEQGTLTLEMKKGQ